MLIARSPLVHQYRRQVSPHVDSDNGNTCSREEMCAMAFSPPPPLLLAILLLSVFPLIALTIHEQEEARQTLVIPGLVRLWAR